MSRIRADKIVNRAGTGAPELPFGVNAPNGLNVTGIVTATSFRGDGSQLSGVDASTLKDGNNVKVQATNTGATVTGTLVATVTGDVTGNVTGNLTGNVTGNVTGTATTATNLADAANITTGTIADARFPATLPAVSGANLTGIPSQADINTLTANVAMLGFKVAASNSLAKFNLVDQVIDEFTDNTGINTTASLNETLSGSGAAKYYSGSTYTSTTTTQTYSYTGNDTTIAVANGQTVTGTVECWGAAGGTDSSPGGTGHWAGGGAYVSGSLNYVSNGDDLIISVGQGGLVGQKGGSGGNGGGYSGIFLGSKTHSNVLIIAGGGGGGGDRTDAAGGGAAAFGGTGASHNNGGGGGTPTAGGTRATPTGSTPSTNGTALTGGHGGADEARQQSASYNGGGIQGQEPGGYGGGGGGGGGYYGGGGGAGGLWSNNGATGGGGGSSYYASGYWTGTPTSAAANQSQGGGTGTSNYPGGGVANGSNGSSAATGGHGAIYVDISVSTAVANDLTLISTNTTASSAPSKADMVMLIEDAQGTSTLNTDIKGYISRDGGTTFTQGTLVDEGTWGTNKKILAFHDLDISSQPSGTDVCYKVTSHNQSASKEVRVHAVSHGWA